MFKKSGRCLKRALSLLLSLITIISVFSLSFSAQAKKKVNTYPAPYNLHAVNYSDTSVKIKWKLKKKLKKNSGYQVLVYNSEKKKYVSYDFTRKTTMIIRNLPDDEIRKIKVRTYVKKKKKKHYGKATVLELPMPPTRATVNAPVYSARGQMTVSWNPVDGASGYILQYSTSASFESYYTSTLIYTAEETEKVINGLGDKTYYVRLCSYKTVNEVNYVSRWSKAVSVQIEKGSSLKNMVNANETDTSGKKAIYKLTSYGVDISKYETTYERLEAIYRWHNAHASGFQNCYYFTINFNKCVDALFGETKKYDNFILMADGNFQNRSGARPVHKWPVIILQGVPLIMDGRIESYIDENCFGLEVGESSRARRFLFSKWYISYRPDSFIDAGFVVKYKKYK